MSPGWAAALLQFIAKNKNAYASPHVYELDDSMHMMGKPDYRVGGFD